MLFLSVKTSVTTQPVIAVTIFISRLIQLWLWWVIAPVRLSGSWRHDMFSAQIQSQILVKGLCIYNLKEKSEICRKQYTNPLKWFPNKHILNKYVYPEMPTWKWLFTYTLKHIYTIMQLYIKMATTLELPLYCIFLFLFCRNCMFYFLPLLKSHCTW